jgi:hypothetical protein
MICLLSSKAFALTYYVDATLGNNSWSGTQSNPWKTIAKVNSMSFNPGDQILFKRGETWRETLDVPSGGSSGNYITYGAYGSGNMPKIMGSSQITGWEVYSGNVWRASCSSYPGGGDNDGPVWFVNTNGDGKIHWSKKETSLGNVNAEYDWYWSGSYLYTYSPVDPDSRYGFVEAAMRFNAIQSDWDTHYVKIENIEASFTARQTINDDYSADYWIIDGCHVHHSGCEGCSTTWAGDNMKWEGEGWWIKNNVFHNGPAHNIQHYSGSSTGDIIEHNTFYDAGHASLDVKHVGPDGTVANQILRYNLIYMTSDYAWPTVSNAAISCLGDMKYGMIDVQIYGNIIVDFWQWGIFIERGVDGVTIYNNVFYGRHPLSTNTDAYPAAIGLFGWNGNPPKNVNIKNNIIAGALQPTDTGIVLWHDDGLDMVLDSDYNSFYITTGHFINADAGDQEDIYDAGDWNAWKTLSGFDEHSKWNYDPKFVNPSGNDFHLQAASPCIDNGTSVGLTRDYEGNPVPLGAAPDIGAFEYVSASGPKTYYVSTTGNDSNPGTLTQPWRTIQKAANNMSAGDTVIANAGNYSGERVLVRRSGSAGAPITFQANGNVFMNGFDVDANYTTIKGFNITATTDRWDDGWGIFAVGHHNIFEDNYVYFCIMGGIQLYVDSTVDPTVTNNCIIRNNKLNRNGMNGISVMGRDNLIEGNEIWDTIQHHPNHAGNENWLDADGMHFFGSGHVFRKNYIHNITLGAPWNVDPHTDCWQHWSADGFEDASNILFEQNYCDITTASYHGQGWMIEPGSSGYRPSNLTMRNNIVKAFSVVNAIGVDGIKIIGNTFLNDPSFIAYPNPNGIHIEDFTNAVVKNNILYDMINHPICLTGSGYDSAQTGGNLEYRSDGQALWINDDWCHYNSTMRAKDLWGVNPQFVNVGAKDYHLQASSPAINAGLNLGTILINDYEGNTRPQGAGYDIGAFEYVSSQPPQPIPGDLNNDTRVDIIDLGIIAIHFGQTNAHPQWNATADAVMSNEIDIYDVVFVASRFT